MDTDDIYPNWFVKDNDEILPYDAASNYPDYYNPDKFTLIGSGYIICVDGELQSFPQEDKMYFWKRNK